MDDIITPVNEGSGDMEDSPTDNNNSVNAFLDKSEESSRRPRTHGNQISHPVPQAELENEQLFETHEKKRTDQNLSNSSVPTSEGIEKTRLKSKKPPSRILQLLLSPVFDEQFTSRIFFLFNNPEAPMQENCRDPLLQRQHSDFISSGDFISGNRPEDGTDIDTPHVHGYQVQLKRISKYASNAQKLLLTVLEEMMNYNEEKDLYSKFQKIFIIYSEMSCFEVEVGIILELWSYLRERYDKLAEVEKKFLSCEIDISMQEVYELLIRIVVTALISTVSEWTSLSFDSIMANYKALKGLYEKFSEFWRHHNEDIKNDDSRIRVIFLKAMIQRLLLQTRNAYRELLMHVGEHAEEEMLNSYEKNLWEEDKNFLRLIL